MNISALIWLCIYLSESFIYLIYLYKVVEDVADRTAELRRGL